MSEQLPSPDVCEQIFHKALSEGDMRGVVVSLELMAPQDPHRAQTLLDSLELGIAIRDRM